MKLLKFLMMSTESTYGNNLSFCHIKSNLKGHEFIVLLHELLYQIYQIADGYESTKINVMKQIRTYFLYPHRNTRT